MGGCVASRQQVRCRGRMPACPGPAPAVNPLGGERAARWRRDGGRCPGLRHDGALTAHVCSTLSLQVVGEAGPALSPHPSRRTALDRAASGSGTVASAQRTCSGASSLWSADSEQAEPPGSCQCITDPAEADALVKELSIGQQLGACARTSIYAAAWRGQRVAVTVRLRLGCCACAAACASSVWLAPPLC